MSKQTITIVAVLAVALAVGVALQPTRAEDSADSQQPRVVWEYAYMQRIRIDKTVVMSFNSPDGSHHNSTDSLAVDEYEELYTALGGEPVEDASILDVLNQIGSFGWELVCVERHNFTIAEIESLSTTHYFKRPQELQ